MIKIPTIKTLILEFVAGNGPSHIREIHLQVSEIKHDVPEHTVRARLSEMSRAEHLEEKLDAFGNGFYGLYQESEDLCSVCIIPGQRTVGRQQVLGQLHRPSY